MEIRVQYERKVSDGQYGNEGFSVAVTSRYEADVAVPSEVDPVDVAWELGGRLREVVRGLLHESQSATVRMEVETPAERVHRRRTEVVQAEARSAAHRLRTAREQVLFAEAKLRGARPGEEAGRAEWEATLPAYVDECQDLETAFKAAMEALRDADLPSDVVDAIIALAQPDPDYDYDAAAIGTETPF